MSKLCMYVFVSLFMLVRCFAQEMTAGQVRGLATFVGVCAGLLAVSQAIDVSIYYDSATCTGTPSESYPNASPCTIVDATNAFSTVCSNGQATFTYFEKTSTLPRCPAGGGDTPIVAASGACVQGPDGPTSSIRITCAGWASRSFSWLLSVALVGSVAVLMTRGIE